MEMPDRLKDVPTGPSASDTGTYDPPIVLPNSSTRVPIPALGQLYHNMLTSRPPGAGNGVQNGQAELLYMIVSIGSPEAMEQFSQSEIGDTNGNGYPEFLDGWGRPIFFLRWAPGFSPYSGVQATNATSSHDPFDPRGIDPNAYQLFPLIYSGGTNSDPGLRVQADPTTGYHYGNSSSAAPAGTAGTMFSGDSSTVTTFLQIGSLPTGVTSYGGITNHYIEQR
jgi:hypothetical protein